MVMDVFVRFPSATEAVRCAIQIQKQLRDEPKVPLRIGLQHREVPA